MYHKKYAAYIINSKCYIYYLSAVEYNLIRIIINLLLSGVKCGYFLIW